MSTAELELFVKKYQTAKNHNSKEIRLTIKEAENLCSAIAIVLSKVVDSQSQIIDLQQKVINTKNEIVVSGGGFN